MIPIQTLSARDAEIMARSIEPGTVTNGRVECHGLQWKSDALRTWEVQQRALGRKPSVSIRVDELELSTVYVETLDGTRQQFRAVTTQPFYTRYLSLYEHRKLKEQLRQLRIKDRIMRMADTEAFNLRLQYYAELGRAEDKVAYRRLTEIRDQLAALHQQQIDSAKAKAQAALAAEPALDEEEATPTSPSAPPPPASPQAAPQKPKRHRPNKVTVTKTEASDQDVDPDTPPAPKPDTCKPSKPRTPRQSVPSSVDDEMPALPFSDVSIPRILL